jgi:two-component system, OmpR family, phosphate regulon sensor histidine kinase PhoR
MDGLSFLLGLGLGGGALWLYRSRLVRALNVLLDETDPSPSSIASSSQMFQHLIALRRENHRLSRQIEAWEAMLDRAPLGFLIVDEDSQLLNCNAKAMRLLGIQSYNPTEPKLLLELVRSTDLDRLIRKTRKTQKPQRCDWLLYPVSVNMNQTPQNQPRPLRGHAFPLDNNQVNVLLESRQEATVLAKARDRWTSDVAHELKTPLTSIRLVAETLQSRLDGPMREWVDRLLQEAMRLSNLVQEILDLSQIEQASRRIKFAPVDLPQLVVRAWQSLEPVARAKRVELDYVGPSYWIMQGEEARLYRVLLNLLDNALKYSPPERPIYLRLAVDGLGLATIDCYDCGCGFAEEDLPFVFERFYRGDPARARGGETVSLGVVSHDGGTVKTEVEAAPMSSGSGLGLAIVQQIVELHQGTIVARNHPDTGGAWIQIQLPQKPN